MLSSGNAQAQPVLGTSFNYGTQSGLTGFFTPVDEKLGFELTGYLDECDLVAVVDLGQFTSGNQPVTKSQLTFSGATYTIRTLKTDQSAYVLGLKKTST